MTLRQFRRLWQIQRVFMRYGLDELVQAIHPSRALAAFAAISPRDDIKDKSQGERIRLALVELGPVFIKFGQALSTRRDLLPVDIADELAKLQDRVPPFPSDQAVANIEASLGQPITELFAAFEQQPLASASIAQVHAATLLDGSDVIVKVLRPGIADIIQRDVEVLYEIARLAARYSADLRRMRPLDVVAEYDKTIFDELDLLREAANASTLRRNFLGSDKLYVPDVHWDYCRADVMVMERIYGIPIGDKAQLMAAGVNMPELSKRGVEIFFTQLFVDNFFHADMHPGNIFVDASEPQRPKYIVVDFGIVGTLTPNDLHYLAQNFVAFFKRDFRRIAELHIESGWVNENTRIDEFESALRSVAEPIFGKPLKDISFGVFLLRLFSIGQRFSMEVQPQLVLLQKTLLNVEGLGRDLDENLNLFETAQPFFERWAREEFGVRKNLEQVGSKLPELPDMLWTLLKRAETGKLQVRVAGSELEQIRKEIRRASKRQYGVTTGGVLLLAAIMMQFGIGLSSRAELWGLILGGVGLFLLLLNWPNDKD